MEIVTDYKIEVVEEGTIQAEGDGWTMTDVPYEITALWEGRNVTYLEDSIKLNPDHDHLLEAGWRDAVSRLSKVQKDIRKEVYKRHCKKADELNAIMPPMHFYCEVPKYDRNHYMKLSVSRSLAEDA